MLHKRPQCGGPVCRSLADVALVLANGLEYPYLPLLGTTQGTGSAAGAAAGRSTSACATRHANANHNRRVAQALVERFASGESVVSVSPSSLGIGIAKKSGAEEKDEDEEEKEQEDGNLRRLLDDNNKYWFEDDNLMGGLTASEREKFLQEAVADLSR